MRSLCFLAAALLLADACQAYQVPTFDPLANINAAWSRDLASATRHFSTLQVQTSTDLVTSDPCFVPVVRLLNATLNCTGPIREVVNIDVTNATSVSAATAACSATCLADLKRLYASFNSTEKRCTGVFGLYAQIPDIYCAKNALKSDEICAVTVNKATGSCKVDTQTACNARDTCLWDTKTSKCGPNPNPAQAALDTFCGSGCVDRLVDAYATIDPIDAERTKASIGAVCLKVNGVYCLAAYNTYGDSSRSDDILKARPDFCSNNTLFTCLRTYFGYAAASAVIDADQKYRRCMTGRSTGTSVATAPADDKKKSCAADHLAVVQASDKLVTLLDVSCATTNGTDQGLPCIPTYNTLGRSQTLQTCSSAFDSGTCSADCDKAFSDALSQLGCCGHFIMRIVTNPLPDDKRLPAITGAGAQTYVGATDAKETRPETYWRPCTNTFANKTLIARCSVPEAQRVKRSLRMNFAFAEISKDTALFARLKAALRKDIAASLAIAEDDIVSDDVTEDTSRQVTVRATSSRQQSTTEQRRNAAKYDFTLAGKDAATTSAAASRFDSASSAGTLTTSSTASAVAACTSCVDTSGSLAVKSSSTPSSPSSPSSPSTSGAAASFVTLALALVAALVL